MDKIFFKFSILSYLDKGLTFLIPLMVPLFFKEEVTIYNEFEYIYAIAIFISVIIDLGLKSFAFYGYKQAKDKKQFLNDLKTTYIGLFRLILLLFLFIIIIHYFFKVFIATELLLFVFIRSVFLFLSYFVSVYYRLLDKPIKMFYLTLPANIIPVILLFLILTLKLKLKLEYLFIGQLSLIVASLFLFKTKNSFTRKNFVIIKEALKFSSPLFINLLIANIVAGYAKVYTHDYLSEFEMYFLSINQRISLIIFLMHTIFITYNTKKIYLSKTWQQDLRLLFNYLKIILISLLFVFGILYFFDIFINPYKQSILTTSTIYLIIYTLFWVTGSYFEAFIGRINKTKQIPLIGIFSGVVYVIVLLNTIKNVKGLTLAMALYSIAYFVSCLTIVKLNFNKK